MTRFVLVPDTTLTYDYRSFPLLDFLPCAPSRMVPDKIYYFLRGRSPPHKPNGELLVAPYSIRRLEVSLRRRFPERDIAVSAEDMLQNFIKDDTSIIAVSTMDPLGLGPTTMSYYALFGGELYAWVWKEWDSLMARINALRRGKKAKLVVGGPGVWEFAIMRDMVEKYNIDLIFEGEADDILPDLFEQIEEDAIDSSMFSHGHLAFDENFRRVLQKDDKFLSRGVGTSAYPKVEDIPPIINPAQKGMTEIMRGCGVGCDFCEVTLRPLRYRPVEDIKQEVRVNLRGGFENAWLHTDEIWGYKHGKMFEPNEEELLHLFSEVQGIKGIHHTNPTHGRISIPAAYPEMLKKLSDVLDAGPHNWIGIQTGVETGSDRLAKMHMPNKTLPLRIGPDGSWQEIVWQGVYNETMYYWRPAFTAQVGQEGETVEDLMDTIAMVNRLSNSYAGQRPFEFTITPLVNVPLGRIKAKKFNFGGLTKEQLAVYYVSYRHLAKMARRDGYRDSRGNFFVRASVGSIISFGGSLMLRTVEKLAVKAGVDIEKIKRYGLPHTKEIRTLATLTRA